MPRRESISIGEYYHIYNRENSKQNIFVDEKDWARFLFLIIYFQSPVIFPNIGRITPQFIKDGSFDIPNDIVKDIVKNRHVELVNFCLMPNHFHLTVKEVEEGGISRYLQRIQVAYTRYFNLKHKKSGHLFQGAFKDVLIESNEQILHLSSYVHRNPRDISKYKDREDEYRWSSFQDYLGDNRWGELLKNEIILEQFTERGKYKEFVDTSGTKLLEFEDEHLFKLGV